MLDKMSTVCGLTVSNYSISDTICISDCLSTTLTIDTLVRTQEYMDNLKEELYWGIREFKQLPIPSEVEDESDWEDYGEYLDECGEETEMNVNIDYHRLSEAREFLSSIAETKREALREKFNMDARNKGPKTFGDILDAIKTGKVTFKEITSTQRDFTAIDSWGNAYDYNWLKFIDFVDPDAPKADTDGFEAATKKLYDEQEAVQMKLTFTTDPAEQLKLLEAFQSSTIN